VLHRQRDGGRVLVLVDPKLHSDVVPGLPHMSLDEEDVYDLVHQARLTLPRP
jgi:hypothetical protein